MVFQVAAGLVPNGVYNVKMSPYNATGNGSTDDRAAIQAAITAAIAAGGGTVFFPAGTYIVGDELTVNGDGIIFQGVSYTRSIIKSTTNSVGTLQLGSLSTSGTGKSVGCSLRDMKFECPSGSTTTNVLVYGATRFEMLRCDIYRGLTGFEMRNADMFAIARSNVRTTASSAVCVNLIQGSSDDVTTGSWLGGIIDMTGTNSTGIVLADGASGSPNEFNCIRFGDGLKIDGNNISGTTGIKFVAGLRNTLFQEVEFKELRAYSIDGVTALLDAQKVFFTIDNCKILGNSTNKPTAHIYLKQPSASGSATNVLIRGAATQLHQATTVCYVESGSPTIAITEADIADATNFLEITAGATPRYIIGDVRISSSSVTNKRGTNQAAGTVTYMSADGNRVSDFKLYDQGTFTLLSGNTSIAFSFSATMDYTPSARDVQIMRTASGGGDTGDKWITSLSTTGGTLNVSTAAAADQTYQFKVRAS